MNQIKQLRYLARGWSLLSLGFTLLIFIGEGLSADAVRPTANEWIGLAFFPGGVCLGLLLAWRYEWEGGTLALFSLAAFYVWNNTQQGRWPDGPFFILVAMPGLLFILINILNRRAIA